MQWGNREGGGTGSIWAVSPFITISSVAREPALPQRRDSQATRVLGPLCPPDPVKPCQPAPRPLPSDSHPSREQLHSCPSLCLSPTPPEAASLAPALFSQMGTELGVPSISAALRAGVFPSGTQTLSGESLYVIQAHLPLYFCVRTVSSGHIMAFPSLWPQLPTPGQKPHMNRRLDM